MSSPITAASATSDLTSSIVRNFDTNQDGSLSTDEFSVFLNRLLGSVPGISSTAVATMSGSTTTGAAQASTATSSRTRLGEFAGFSMAKMDDPAVTSFKYQIGRILQFYPNTVEGLQQALPEIQQIVPGAKIVGSNGDKIDFGDYVDARAGRIGIIDVILAAGGPERGRAWTWQLVEQA